MSDPAPDTPAPPSSTPAAAAPPAADAATPPKKRGGLVKWLLRGAIAFAILLVVAVLGRNVLLRKGLETTVSAVTGFPLTIGSFDLGLSNTRVEVKDMVLSNPSGFEDPSCISIGTLVIDPELSTLMGASPHIEDLDLSVDEVVVVKNAAGDTNLDRLKALGGGGGGGKTGDGGDGGGKGGSAGGGPAQKMRIDRLHLRIGKVRFLDYSRATKDGKPREDTWDLGIDEEFRDLDSPEKVVRVIVLRVLQKTNIKLVTASVENLAEGLGGVVTGAGEAIGSVVEGVGEGVGKGVKGVGDALGGLLGK